jgi:phage FluMu gp28-like protein
MQRKTALQEQEEWMQNERDNCFDEYTWLQEYCCVAVDEACAFLPYDLIVTCELDDVLKSLEDTQNDLFIGVDVGRKKDLTVIWVLEKLEQILYTRSVIELAKTPFHKQEEVLSAVLSRRNFRRCCPDSTGIGMQLSENAQLKFGQYRVEPIMFTNRIKEELAYTVRTNFENRTVFIPKQHEIREDLHSVRRITTAASNIRFDADHSANGHADRFWALALALHAAGNGSGEIHISTRKKLETLKITEGF